MGERGQELVFDLVGFLCIAPRLCLAGKKSLPGRQIFNGEEGRPG